MNNKFSQEVIGLLKKAGWHKDRSVIKKLQLPALFNFHDTAIKILDEFGNLRLGKFRKSKGLVMAKSTIHFSPILAEGEDDRFKDFSNQLGVQLCPLGEVNEGYSFLAIDENGKIYILDQDIHLVGNDIQEGIETLLTGGKIHRL